MHKAMLEERKENLNITMNEIAKILGISRTAVNKLKIKYIDSLNLMFLGVVLFNHAIKIA
ncbi:TPA: helix-turn-helix transcriptional regulator [Vibrio vulnificus]|uniref:HTH domain-containing protein n=1 Tax=Vibrio parahaemolyticus TaxID=670 RepID=UPI0012AD6C89|nr:helix-turn-helix transcriptional regulator [Vibrio parahaemolyticus]HDY7685525.1 helix-turn-helix transcriptional regulator [Vibrio vulnificus]